MWLWVAQHPFLSALYYAILSLKAEKDIQLWKYPQTK